MKRFTILTITLLLAISTFSCKESTDPQPAADESAANPFLGLWTVEYDRTLESAKQSPKYRPEDAEKMPDLIRKMMEMMKIEITETQMIYFRGDISQPAAYTVKAKTDDILTIILTVGDTQAEMTLTLIDNKYMNIKSTGTDDTDYYIWQPAPASQ